MIGQERLLAQLQTYSSITALPPVLFLIGPEGSGKHLLATQIANHFQYPLQWIHLGDSLLTTDIQFYGIDLSDLTFREQAKWRTVLESRPVTAHLIFIAEARDLVAEILQTQGECWMLQPYTESQLQSFLPSDFPQGEIRDVILTPGQAQQVHSTVWFQEMLQLCNLILTKMKDANFANALSLVHRFQYRPEEELKIPLGLFFNCMLKQAAQRDFRIYQITLQYQHLARYKSLNLTNLMESYIIQLWKETHNGYSRT